MADNALMRHRRMQETQRAFAEQFNRETPQDYPVVERSSLLPLATYGNGQTGLAWPGMIAEDIPNALTAPARAYRGELGDYLDNRDAYLSEGLNFAGTAALGGSVVPKPMNAAGMFGGRLAKTADHTALAKAEELAAKGTPREDIWNQTGWFKGVDGKWRFEIDDSSLTLNAPVRRGGYLGNAQSTLGAGDIIAHSALTDAYPELANMSVRVDGNSRYVGSHFWPGKTPEKSAIVLADHRTYRPEWRNQTTMDPDHVFMNTNGPYTFRSTAAHELQHAVGSIDGSLPPQGLGASVRISWPEVEARTVEKRLNLSPEERRARPPWIDYDVPEADQIVRFNTLAANSTNSSLPGTILAEAADQAPRVSNPIRAYHGSPHDFDKFDLSKIGTGEGAQAYGHGLYFAENEGVARSYRNGLSDAGGVTFGGVKPSAHATASLLRNNYDVTATLADLNNAASVAKGWGDNALLAKIKDDIAEIEGFAGKPMQSPGRLYEVNIHASPDDFLDWDKPLSQQSDKVMGALNGKNVGVNVVPHPNNRTRYALQKPDGTLASTHQYRNKDLAEYEANLGNYIEDLNQKALAGSLREAGIPGIRYLDQGSRTAGGGTSNYVVFDPNIIEILRKYGLLGTLGAGAAASAYGAPPAEAAQTNALMRHHVDSGEHNVHLASSDSGYLSGLGAVREWVSRNQGKGLRQSEEDVINQLMRNYGGMGSRVPYPSVNDPIPGDPTRAFIYRSPENEDEWNRRNRELGDELRGRLNIVPESRVEAAKNRANKK